MFKQVKFYFSLLFLFVSPLAAIQNSAQVVILGSGPAGLTAAIYTSRAGLSTLVIEGEEPGGQIALSTLVENFPGFPEGISGFELGEKMREQAVRFGTKIKGGKVIRADLSRRPFLLTLESGEAISAETLIIASGASAKWLGLESEKAFIGNGVSSCAVCDGFLYQDEEVVVVGGGDTAMEDALFLTNYASKVTVVHRNNTLKASAYLQKKAFAHPKIQFIWNHVVEKIADPEINAITHVELQNINTKERKIVPCRGVFIAIGHEPNTGLLKGHLETNQGGYLVTKPYSTSTMIEGVFAAGDVADHRYRQAISAAGSGCMAGIDAYHFIQENNH